jgi:hypothetical protein
MPYTAEISRTRPGCFLFLVDQSTSMNDVMAGAASGAMRRKADSAATVLNKFLQNLVIKCGKNEGIRDWFQVGVIGYGATVAPAFGGAISGRDLVPISEIANTPARVEERTKKVDDGAGGFIEQKIKFPVWFDAVANGGTPMCQALWKANEIVTAWVAMNPASFPPIVINVTDGESSDGNPSASASSLKAIATADGNVLLFNIHISSKSDSAIEFPDSDAGLPDDFARELFNSSSTLTEPMQAFAKQKGYNVHPASKGFIFNGELVSLIDFIDIGTRPSNLR